MDYFNMKDRIIEDISNGVNVVIIDPENEFETLSKMFEDKVLVTIDASYRGTFNPFLVVTEQAQTIGEKELKLREFLDASDYGEEYAKQRLNDMSFLDDTPEWKERAILILKEYAKY